MDKLFAFLLSMLPIIELRGGIIYAAAKGIPFPTTFTLCLLGNILPIPLILLFICKIFELLKKYKYTASLVKSLESRARAKSGAIEKYQLLGLFILVAIPLPGTGAWTGALIAAIMEIPLRKSFPTIALGVLGAESLCHCCLIISPVCFLRLLNYTGEYAYRFKFHTKR